MPVTQLEMEDILGNNIQHLPQHGLYLNDKSQVNMQVPYLEVEGYSLRGEPHS